MLRKCSFSCASVSLRVVSQQHCDVKSPVGSYAVTDSIICHIWVIVLLVYLRYEGTAVRALKPSYSSPPKVTSRHKRA